MAGGLIDTHIWIWWMGQRSELSTRYRAELNALDEPPLLSVISLWELSMLVERRSLQLKPSPLKWLDRASRRDAVHLAQITPDVGKELLSLPKTFQGDPADRIIVATARAMNAPLMTMDKRIRRSKLVRLWEPM